MTWCRFSKTPRTRSRRLTASSGAGRADPTPRRAPGAVLKFIAQGRPQMTTREVIDRYYDCVNRGDWQQWLTLFSDDVVGDEQLAGHFAGIGVLQGAIDGIRNGYRVFRMHPQRMVIDGDAAVVVWRFEGQNSHGV